MVTITICCQHCGSEDLVRNGYAPNGKQRYRCKSCKRQSRENPAPAGRELVLAFIINRYSKEVGDEDNLRNDSSFCQ